MTGLILTTYDWVPEMPRGFVRDIRVRWALEEAGLPYQVESVPFDDRSDPRYAQQPFSQVPWLRDDDASLFESGAILLHLGEKSSALLPDDADARRLAVTWLFAALNSVEMAALPWALLQFREESKESDAWRFFDDWLTQRLGHLEPVLAGGGWIAGTFSIADIALADILRLIDRFEGLARSPACRAYLDRAVARPAFTKALADQHAHFAAGDAQRAAPPS